MERYTTLTVTGEAGKETVYVNVARCSTWSDLEKAVLECEKNVLAEGPVGEEMKRFSDKSLKNFAGRLVTTSGLIGIALASGGAALPALVAAFGSDRFFKDRQKRIETHPFGSTLGKIWEDHLGGRCGIVNFSDGTVLICWG